MHFFKKVPAHIDNLNNIFETTKCDKGGMDFITEEIRSCHKVTIKSLIEAKSNTLKMTSETQYLHVDDINIYPISLFSAIIIKNC